MKSAKSNQQQKGAAMVEYSVVTLVVVAALFLPMPGAQDSLLTTLMDALRQFQSHSMLLLSLP